MNAARIATILLDRGVNRRLINRLAKLLEAIHAVMPGYCQKHGGNPESATVMAGLVMARADEPGSCEKEDLLQASRAEGPQSMRDFESAMDILLSTSVLIWSDNTNRYVLDLRHCL